MLLDGHRASSWSTFLRSALLPFPSNLPPWYSTCLTMHKPVFTLWSNLLQTIIQSVHWTEQQKRLFKETMVLWVPFFCKLLFSTLHQLQGWQLLCDIIPSKILHNLKSVAIVNLISYQDFATQYSTAVSLHFENSQGHFGTAATRTTFFTPESLNFFDKPTLLPDTKFSMSKLDRHILRKPPPPSIPTLTSRDLLVSSDFFCKTRSIN